MLRAGGKRLIVGECLGAIFPDEFPILPSPSGHVTISPFSQFSLGVGVLRSGWTTIAWTANDAMFIPFRVPVPCILDKFVVGAGGTSSGNFDVGVYDKDGNLLVSTGATAKSSNVEQIVDVTDTYLSPGLYYLALSHSNNATWGGMIPSNVGYCKLMGMRKMASAHPLPSTATFATVTAAFVPFISARVKIDPSLLAPGVRPKFPPLNVVTPAHPESSGLEIAANVMGGLTGWAAGASGAAVANQARYYPFFLHEPALARKMSILIGAGTTGNLDVGIYNAAWQRIVNSGSTALGAANTLQEIDITDTELPPGLYFMAYQFSSSSGTLFRVTGSNDYFSLPLAPYYEEAVGSFGLPATATPVDATATTPVTGPAFGVHFDTLV